MHEIDPKTANFDEIMRFAINLLGESKIDHPNEYEARVAYFSTATHVVLARRADDSTSRLTAAIDKVAGIVQTASTDAGKDSKRMVIATRWLAVGTLVLAIATAGLVYYTRELVRAELAAQANERATEARPAPAPAQRGQP